MFSNHNGGSLMFDKLQPSILYITVGDGGSGPTGRVLNYGWDVFEGNKGAVGQGCTGTKQTCPLGRIRTLRGVSYVCPIAVESHSNGWASLIGGYVCRTCGDPQLVGKFLYADFMLPKSLRAVSVRGNAAKLSLPVKLCTNSTKCVVQTNATPLDLNWMVFSFAEDNLGRISLVHAALGLYRITDPANCNLL
ncbi:hypothetical protein BASA81_003355 [Batrachochytrium salamandrivorans]|nr:hypothetical protein BASA81_003355 [Batrachochytrium salamandrivorans]